MKMTNIDILETNIQELSGTLGNILGVITQIQQNQNNLNRRLIELEEDANAQCRSRDLRMTVLSERIDTVDQQQAMVTLNLEDRIMALEMRQDPAKHNRPTGEEGTHS